MSAEEAGGSGITELRKSYVDADGVTFVWDEVQRAYFPQARRIAHRCV
jgi:hypothetical protein